MKKNTERIKTNRLLNNYHQREKILKYFGYLKRHDSLEDIFCKINFVCLVAWFLNFLLNS